VGKKRERMSNGDEERKGKRAVGELRAFKGAVRIE
jgi:hypothetical protein